MSEEPKDQDFDNKIWVSSIVSNRTKEGMVNIQWGGKAAQMSTKEARELGLHLLEAAEAAESDAGIFHVITTKVGLPEDGAFKLLIDLRAYREEKEKQK